MKRFKCTCGLNVSLIKIVNGKIVCDYCYTFGQSGHFMRRVEGERAKYAKDILQAFNKDGSVNKDYVDAYGTGYYEKNKSMTKEEVLNGIKK